MFAHLPRRGPHPRTAARQAAARLRRLAALGAALLAATAAVLLDRARAARQAAPATTA
jgi:hypothetical protein